LPHTCEGALSTTTSIHPCARTYTSRCRHTRHTTWGAAKPDLARVLFPHVLCDARLSLLSDAKCWRLQVVTRRCWSGNTAWRRTRAPPRCGEKRQQLLTSGASRVPWSTDRSTALCGPGGSKRPAKLMLRLGLGRPLGEGWNAR